MSLEAIEMMNHIKTTLLLSLLTVVIILMGSAAGGKAGMIFAFFMVIAMSFFSFWFSEKIVLKMYGAREINRREQLIFQPSHHSSRRKDP